VRVWRPIDFVTDGGGVLERRKRNSGQLYHAPRESERARLGSGFGTRFSVCVDTEEEFDWTKPRSRDQTETSHIRHLKEFQSLADAHGIRPCYLIDYPVAHTPEAAAIMAELYATGRCQIGTQLHAWVNPPHDEIVNTFNSFAGNLPIDLERAKLLALTQEIERNVGVKPDIYRAGRYGIGLNSSTLLEELGYRVDTSVRPHFDYSHEGGPSFLRHDSRPYWAGPNGLLLELPLGVAFTGQMRRIGRWLYGTGRGRRRLLSGLARSGMLARVALTPEDMPEQDVRDAISALLDDGLQYLSFSFHSPSVAPGHTPYVRNSAELSDFYRWWDRILNFLAQRGVAPAGIDEVVEAAWASRSDKQLT
jgi:hypothetical protein